MYSNLQLHTKCAITSELGHTHKQELKGTLMTIQTVYYSHLRRRKGERDEETSKDTMLRTHL